MAQAVDYGAGTSAAIATQYADLRQALAGKGEAENRQKAREIERKGLFGTGIKSSDIQDFGNIAIKGAEFGEARMERKMDRATKSFERRKLADERRIASLKERAKGTSGKVYEDLVGQIQGIEMGMTEKRNSFEDYIGKYQDKGIWGTKFGGDDVGYRTEGESKYSQAMRPKPGSEPGGPEGEEVVGGEGRFAPEGDRIDRYSSYPQGREFENTASFSEIEKKRRGQAEDMKKRLGLRGITNRIAEKKREGIMNLEPGGMSAPMGPGYKDWGQTQGFTKNPEWNQFTNSQRATDEDSSIVPRRHKMMQSSIVPSDNW